MSRTNFDDFVGKCFFVRILNFSLKKYNIRICALIYWPLRIGLTLHSKTFRRTIMQNLSRTIFFLLLFPGCLKIQPKSTLEASPGVTAAATSSDDKAESTFEPLVIDGEVIIANNKLVPLDANFDFKKFFLQKLTAKKQRVNFKNFVLTSNAKIYTLGQDVEINVENIISTQGTITTFPDSFPYFQGKNGISGRSIILNITSGRGLLNIFLRGQPGSPGCPGPEPTADLKGADSVLPALEFNGPHGSCHCKDLSCDSDPFAKVRLPTRPKMEKQAILGKLGFLVEIQVGCHTKLKTMKIFDFQFNNYLELGAMEDLVDGVGAVEWQK